MKYYCSLIACLLFFAACGNTPSQKSNELEETPRSVTNYLTEQYKDFPGTKLSLLPGTFTYDAGFDGWSSQSKRSWIVASTVQGKPMMAAGLYKARLSDPSRPDAIDGTLVQEWDVTMNARQAKLFKIETTFSGDDHLQYVLFTGDTVTGYRVTGDVHEDEIELAPQVKKSVLSIFYDPERITKGQNPTQTSASPCNCPK